jgi:hypothetical protein
MLGRLEEHPRLEFRIELAPRVLPRDRDGEVGHGAGAAHDGVLMREAEFDGVGALPVEVAG